MKNLFPTACALTLCVTGSLALAQVGVHGRISTRSDVKMSIEGLPGTVGSKLDAMAKQLGTPLGEVKRCYAELVKVHPDVVGKLVVDLELPEGKGAAKVRVPDPAPKLSPMERCIDRAFGKLTLEGVPRPAGAKVTLELTNSAAESADDVKERGEAASQVAVKQGAGGFESQGKSTQGEVSFKVSSKDSEALVERVHQGVRDALPSLFDCRRKAGKKGSPEGDVVADLSLRPNDKPKVKIVSCSVQSERAPPCVERALGNALQKVGKGNAQVTLHFAP